MASPFAHARFGIVTQPPRTASDPATSAKRTAVFTAKPTFVGCAIRSPVGVVRPVLSAELEKVDTGPSSDPYGSSCSGRHSPRNANAVRGYAAWAFREFCGTRRSAGRSIGRRMVRRYGASHLRTEFARAAPSFST